MDPFKLLTSGIKFDRNKFCDDLKRFKQNKLSSKSLASSIDSIDSSSKFLTQKSDVFVNDVEQLRLDHQILVDGDDISSPITSFDDIDITESLRCRIKQSDYQIPTAIQMQTIPLMLADRSIIGCAPTGSGKTLAFILPLLIKLRAPSNQGFRAIVLTPTRELAKQIHRETLWLSNGTGLRVHLIKNINLAKKKFSLESKLKYDILITTPKRLQFLLGIDSPLINIQSLEWLIVDECDRLFQTTFLEQLSSIVNQCHRYTQNQLKLGLFSATYDRNLHHWCESNLNHLATIIIGERNKIVETIDQKLIFTGTESGKLFALKEIINRGCQTPALIFVNSVRKANYLQMELERMNLCADTIHSGRNQEFRDRIVRRFREGQILFLVCTELMSRGIDFKAVNLVINYDLPSTTVAYIHHIGRTGRAGRNGTSITFYTSTDEKRIFPFLKIMRQSGCQIPEHLSELNEK
ncbi:ATP-dependent RNA helicase DDX52-like protein [Sarcoptes scabiei]|uniref:Probable ATP-dependent RNA helicase DDX52 n=1 Tax=Sarcoptes scabiei TaxID=52283 RepID=A0A132AHI0_SARSC|nr:ATP-dependent RNA helicase DDX52-like protein [Sarcoptes scabiei]